MGYRTYPSGGYLELAFSGFRLLDRRKWEATPGADGDIRRRGVAQTILGICTGQAAPFPSLLTSFGSNWLEKQVVTPLFG
jgi:hypothetical protein